MKKVGFIGLGWMGRGMCKAVTRGGFDVIVYDAFNVEAMDDLVKYGAKVKASSVKEVGKYAEIVGVCVRDGYQVEEVVAGKDGLFDNMASGSIVVVHSTVSPVLVQKLAEEGKKKGIAVIDSPMTGQKREEGELTLMVGAGQAEFNKALPYLETMAFRVLHMGDVGCGETTKLVSNCVASINMRAITEVLTLGMKAGISKVKLLEQLGNTESPGNNWAASHWAAMEEMKKIYKETRKGPAELGYKDMALFMSVSRELGLELPLSALVANIDVGTLPEDFQ